MEARTEPVVGVTAISLHPAPTVSPAVACSSSKRFAAVAEVELTSNDDALPPHSKKRRKQSRPIRIPTPTSPVPLAVQDEGDAEEAEEGELKSSAYLLQPRQNDEHDQVEKNYPPSSDASSGYASSMHSLLPSLLSFPPHFLLPMLPAGPTPNPTAAPPPRIFNLEAYCEICSKEFCNKYFLKTHKANRHGIYVQSGDTPPMSTTPLPPVSAPSPTVQTPPAVKPGVTKPAAATTASDQKASCDTCHKKFNHEHSVKRHKAKVHWGGGAEGVSETNVDEASRPPCSPSSVHEPESASVEPVVEEHIPPATSPLSPGRLRRLGVINADAFCEICSKEYCNKYFLKTHKLKRHGIIVRDSDDMKVGDFKPTSCKPKMWEQGATSIQTSPLNLTVHEQATCSNSSDSGVLRTEEVEKQEAPSPRPDSRDISEDLQKLQTMLLQLNALNGTSVSCESFMAPQHDEANVDVPAANLENGAVGDSSHESPISPAMPPASVVLEVNDDFVQHMSEELGETTPRQLEAEDAETQSGGSVPFSTSCYCDICNKELCNKYFKKVHMQKMHGIEIKDNALSGGVPCDICHKQLCSKYFVRVHKQNTHGIVDLSAPTPPNSGRGSAGSPLDAPVQLPLHTTPPEAAKSSETADLSHRYYTHFNVVCPLCSRRFRSAKWLKAHLLNDHAEVGLEIARELDSKPKLSNNNSSKTTDESSEVPVTKESSTSAAMLSSLLRCGVDERTTSYHCSYCNFSTPVLSLLFVHERTHTGLGATPLQAPAPRNTLTCHLCFKSFGQSDLLQRHLRSHQLAGLQVSDESPSDDSAKPKESRSSSAGRYRCAHCHQRFRTRDQWSTHMQCHSNRNEQEAQSTPSSQLTQSQQSTPFCCPLCPYSSDSLTIFKKHVKQEHWLQQEGTQQQQQQQHQQEESRLWRSLAQVEVSRTLQDAARESHVPATYAVPQATPENFIMQPFLLEEPPETAGTVSESATASCSEAEATTATATSSTDGTFVPSLVFLPVREKVSGTLTVSFTLTPA